jgi:hypothetical protein
MSLKIEVHSIQDGVCSLSGKQGEVLVVTIADGTAVQSALSVKSLMQILRMKLGQKSATPVVAIPMTESESA